MTVHRCGRAKENLTQKAGVKIVFKIIENEEKENQYFLKKLFPLEKCLRSCSDVENSVEKHFV